MTDRKRVLVVEETKTTRDMLCFLLSNRGYDVLEAATGKEALHLVPAFLPDLVVLSADLLDLSGYDVYGILKRRPATSLIPILLLVAFTEMLNAPTRTLPNPEYLLSKPFTAHDFLQRTGKLLSVAPEPARL